MAQFQLLRPMLDVNDLSETIAFYRDVLGFEVLGTMGEDPAVPTWCSLGRDEVKLMFTWSPPHDHGDGDLHAHEPALGGMLYITVDDADALYAEVTSRGAKAHGEPVDQPYGNRDFIVEDPNGFQLCFGSSIDQG